MEIIKDDIEVWSNIKGYEGFYQVSNWGNIKSLDREVEFYRWGRISSRHYSSKLVPQFLTLKGYLQVTLSREGTNIKYSVHRLVAQAYIHNTENKPQVNHKDLNKLNNHFSNLEWATQIENMIHAKKNNVYIGLRGDNNPMYGKTGNRNHNFGEKSPNSKAVIQKSLEGAFIKKWGCSMDIKRELKISNKEISKCLVGVRKSAGGFRWEYA